LPYWHPLMNMTMIGGGIKDIDVLFFGSLPPPHFFTN